MNVLFIGVYADEDSIRSINRNSKPNGFVANSAVNYTNLIAKGIKANNGDNSTYLFLEPIGLYPLSKFILRLPKYKDGNYYIPFFNILFIKHLTISISVFCFSIYWYFKNSNSDGKKIVMIGGVYAPFLLGIFPLKLLKNFSVVTFVPDLPEYENSYENIRFSFKSFLIPFNIWVSKALVRISDYFVFITRFMIDKFPQKPYSIMEGLCDQEVNSHDPIIHEKSNSIMYAGSLYEKFGIEMLLDAFIKTKGSCELWLFGKSDMRNVIEAYSKIDNRIKFFGVRPFKEILEFEKKARLLVNPRFSNNTFTKFSFPSKLMEYMASGTPVLTTKLGGIPSEYYDKLYFIDDETVDGLAAAINLCLSKSQSELDLIGNNAREFVLKEKNCVYQLNKLFVSIKSALN